MLKESGRRTSRDKPLPRTIAYTTSDPGRLRRLVSVTSHLECLKALSIEVDVQGFLLSDEYGAEGLPLGFLHPFTFRIDDFPFPAFLKIAVEYCECGRVLQCLGRRVRALFEAYDHMRSRCASRMEPEIIAFGEAEGQLVVFFRVASDIDRESVCRRKFPERALADLMSNLALGRDRTRCSLRN